MSLLVRILLFPLPGGAVDYEMEGFEARVVQHEIDHLDGRLFPDRLVSRRSDLFAHRHRGAES